MPLKVGLALYSSLPLPSLCRASEMKPLTECLDFYLEKRSKDPRAPKWILFHDTDEYLFPIDTNLTIPEALGSHNSTCCVQVFLRRNVFTMKALDAAIAPNFFF